MNVVFSSKLPHLNCIYCTCISLICDMGGLKILLLLSPPFDTGMSHSQATLSGILKSASTTVSRDAYYNHIVYLGMSQRRLQS